MINTCNILQSERDKLKHSFEGYYFKHQKDDFTLCVIVGKSHSETFIQIITEHFSKKVPVQKGNIFSRTGILLNIKVPGLTLSGRITYKCLSPIKYDIMGPFHHFPMECSHGIISMYHRLEGFVILNGEFIDFTGGIGYIEKDSGVSFPSDYFWIQANGFAFPCSIMASVAEIPFYGMHFTGCICILQWMGREYRLATYLGAKVLVRTRNRIVIKQGRYVLDIRVDRQNCHELSAPQDGKMTRIIREAVSCPAEFRFYENGTKLLQVRTKRASFE